MACCLVFGCSAGIPITSLVMSMSGTEIVQNMDNTCLSKHETVRSFEEFLHISNRTSMHLVTSSVALKISHPIDWPLGSNIENPKPVCDFYIAGKMHANKIVDLLAQCPVLRELRIKNEKNLICSEAQINQAGTSRPKVILTNEILVLEDFSSDCIQLLNTLENQIEMTSLKEFKFIRGNLDILTMMAVERILRKSSTSLIKLEILESTNSIELFDSINMVTFPNVRTIVYDITTDLIPATHPKFCSRFPSLEHFSAGDGMKHPRDDITNLLGCSNLKTMKTKIHVTDSSTSVGFLTHRFPKLRSAEIYFDFETCESEIFVRGIGVIPEDLVVNLDLTSKCKNINYV